MTDSEIRRVHKDFDKEIKKLMKEYKDNYNLKIKDYPTATKLFLERFRK